jgi:hypothetical protein
MHRDFLDAAASVGSLGGQPLRTSVNVIGAVPQSWTMRKQSMNEVSGPLILNTVQTVICLQFVERIPVN